MGWRDAVNNRVFKRLRLVLARRAVRRNVASAFIGRPTSFVSQNCLGARLSNLAGQPYNSPTVDVWFRPSDFLTFVENLEQFRGLKFVADLAASEKHGYPVGVLGGGDTGLPAILAFFQHFKSLAEAQAAWDRRYLRLDYERMIVVMTDRDGATESDLVRFEALPYPRIALTARLHPHLPNTCHVPGYESQGYVGDLYSDWHRLTPPLTDRLKGLAAAQPPFPA